MFRYRSLVHLLVVFAFAVTGCVSDKPGVGPRLPTDPPVVVSDSEITDDGFVKELPYKIIEIDDETGKVVNTYFALGKNMRFDPVRGELSFTDLNGENYNIKSTMEFEGQYGSE
jgi:hypothetical protein